MRYSGEQLEQLANKVDIVELIGQTEDLQRRGQNYFIKCPFHDNDDTPSLCINPETNKWHCFGCGAGSSIFDWVMHKDNINFVDAVEKICKIVGEEPSNYTESESITFLKTLKKQKVIKDDLNNVRTILDFTDDYLNKYSDEPPKEWLLEGMSHEALKTYNIRVDHNANRIVYPVFDSEGNFIGVKGRTRIDAYKALGLAKYMNYYKVGALDYFQGWQQAYPEFINAKSVIIFEGIKSCIKAWDWGIRNTIASETAALSDGQLKLLIKNGFNEVIFGWDTDQKFRDIIKDPKIQMLKKFTDVSIIVDKNKLLEDKMSPVDKGEKIFKELLDGRVRI